MGIQINKLIGELAKPFFLVFKLLGVCQSVGLSVCRSHFLTGVFSGGLGAAAPSADTTLLHALEVSTPLICMQHTAPTYWVLSFVRPAGANWPRVRLPARFLPGCCLSFAPAGANWPRAQLPARFLPGCCLLFAPQGRTGHASNFQRGSFLGAVLPPLQCNPNFCWKTFYSPSLLDTLPLYCARYNWTEASL